MEITEYSGPSSGMKDSPFLAAEDIDVGQDVEVVIESCVFIQGATLGRGRVEDKYALKFEGKEKMLILNATNRKSLSLLYGSLTEEWKGKPCTLYVQRGIRNPGDPTDDRGIRIRRPSQSDRIGEAL